MTQNDPKAFNLSVRSTILAIYLLLLSPPTLAAPPQTVTGVPIVDEIGVLVINGQKISLWGLDNLASDQQCWQGEVSWCCGEYALIALRHFVEGRNVECELQHEATANTLASGKCYRLKGQTRQDIAQHLIHEGWALEKGETTGGAYFDDEQSAQDNKKGIWSGRFQTAQDWRDGVQRFIGEEEKRSLGTITTNHQAGDE